MMMLNKAVVLVCAAMVSIPLIGIGSMSAKAFSDHEGITDDGLSDGSISFSFLHRHVTRDINREHDWMDGGVRLGDDEKHFDDCEFNGAIDWINDRYSGLDLLGLTFAVDQALQVRNLFAVAKAFGRILHPAQDFYSHSNWVELGFPRADDPSTPNTVEGLAQSDLVDISGAQRQLGTPWSMPGSNKRVREDILLADDDWVPGFGWSVRKNGAARFQSQLVRPDGTVAGRLLETGYGRNDFGWLNRGCHIDYTGYDGFSHEELNKDGSDHPNYLKARALAVLQTGYEWCRLVARAGQLNRDGMLLTLWVRDQGGSNAPHPPNTPCQKRTPNGLLVHPTTVTVESIQIRDVHDSGYLPGEIQLSAALYDDPQNFHQSDHKGNRSGKRMLLNAGDYVPRSELPEPMTICVRAGSEVNFSMFGWDNDEDASDIRYGRVYDNVGDDDEMLIGGRARFSSESLGVQTARWEDLIVRYRVSRQLPSGSTATCAPTFP